MAPETGHRLRLFRSATKENDLWSLSFCSLTSPNHFCLRKKIWFSRQVPEQEKTSPKGLVFSWLTLADALRTASAEYDEYRIGTVKQLLVGV